MLQFYNFLTLLSEYRQAITQYESETITMIFNTVTDFRLSIDLIITIQEPSTTEAKASISLSVNDDGEVKAEILDGTYSARMLSMIEYATLVMYNLVNNMLRSIEEAKAEVLNNE